jgi:8-oxo-dGTP pyrophosphatase MutT (NUDIX family)
MNYKWKEFISEGELKIVGIVICVNDKEEFLIIRRSDIDKRAGQWTMPGGHIDDEDGSIEQGAIRELEEETGLSCKVSDLIYLGEPRFNKHYYLTQKWTGSVNVNKPNPHTGEVEHDDWRWATIEEIKEIENTEIPIYLLEKAVEKAKNETPI